MTQNALLMMLAEIGDLLAKRLDARGVTLAAKARAAGVRVPRKLRADLALLVAAEPRAAHPKLAAKTDLAGIRAAHRRLKSGLKRIPHGKYTRRARSALVAQIAGQVLVISLLVLVVLRWRGFV